MDNEDKRRSAEILKDMIVDEKRSRWALVFGVIALLAMLGGAAYWFYLPPDQRPALESLGSRLGTMVHSVMNTPVMAPAATPGSSPVQKSTATTSNDTGLLSN